MPTPRLNVSSSWRAAHRAGLRDQVEDRLRCPGRPVDERRDIRRQHAPQVAREPAAGDVRERVHVAVSGQRQAVPRVDAGRFEQLVGQRAPAQLGWRRVQRHARAARGAPASSRSSAARTSRARSGRHRPEPGPPRGLASALTTPTAAPETSYSSGRSTPGCSAVSPPTSAQPACTQPFGDAADDGRDLLRHHLAGGDVVGHEQRLGADDHQVVDHHRDQVDADRVVPVDGLGDHELGADPVGGAGKNRLRVLGEIEPNSPANPPRPPSTSGRPVRLTAAFISSTARSPAAMSTPAPA